MSRQNTINTVNEYDEAQFEATLRSGLNSSYEASEISVSEDLIANTLKRIKEADAEQRAASVVDIQSVQHRKRVQFTRIAAGIAAAFFLGILGIGVIRANLITKSSSNAFATNDTATVNHKSTLTFAALNSEQAADMNSGSADLDYDCATGAYGAYEREDVLTSNMMESASEESCDGCDDIRLGSSLNSEPKYESATVEASTLDEMVADSAPLYELGAYGTVLDAGDSYQQIEEYLASLNAKETFSGCSFDIGPVQTEGLGELLLSASTFITNESGLGSREYIVYEKGFVIKYCDNCLSSSSTDYRGQVFEYENGADAAAKIKGIVNK